MVRAPSSIRSFRALLWRNRTELPTNRTDRAKSRSFHTGQTPVMKYNRQLMQAIMWDRINIAEVVGVQVISLDQAPQGYGEFDAGVPKKFVIDPHKMFSAA